MSERAIQGLKRKFVMTALLSFLAVMLFMSGAIYVTNQALTRSEIHEVMDYIIANHGILKESDSTSDEKENAPASQDTSGSQETSTEDATEALIDGTDVTIQKPGTGSSRKDFADQLQRLFGVGTNYDSPEFFYSTRYFAVIYDSEGRVSDVITSHIAAIEDQEAVEYANRVRDRWVKFGSFGDYYYQAADMDNGSSIVIYLDCTSQVAFSRRIVYVSLILIFCGILLSWMVLRLLADRIVQPEIRNAELQKSFITNASHELKTPLAVIRANTELQEMTSGENEWTQSTLRQVDRMQGLIQNLVMITRAQEKDGQIERTNIDVSVAVSETVKTFEPVASQDGKEIISNITEGITMLAEEGQIRQLTSLLVDNAIKYCDDHGKIEVSLDRKGKNAVRLVIRNDYADGANVDYTRFFDRFYRADESHNQDKGGYGIGLSIAENIVDSYHGSIDVSWDKGVIAFTCVL